MCAFHIIDLRAMQILDSRGRPTLSVTLTLAGGATGWAGVPSGASTGAKEAAELRDGDTSRYGGAGVTRAAARITGSIFHLLKGRPWHSLADVDHALIELDGTPDKSRLGGNAIVGVSMATARAVAAAHGQQLWEFLTPNTVRPRLPVPHFNLISGGLHASNRLDFQDFMIAPIGAPSMAEAVRAGAEIYAVMCRNLAAAGRPTGQGDEGGFAPDFTHPREVLAALVTAIDDAGYVPARDQVAIALDPAASRFRRSDGTYHVAGERLSSLEMIELYADLAGDYPIWSIEDGLGEDDTDGWRQLTDRLGERLQLVGDDVFVTNPAIIKQGIAGQIGNAALIKVNQVGTVTETLQAMELCRKHGYALMVSHRSGETVDDFIAELSVASGCGQIKSGAPARGERVIKYNRLLHIASQRPDLPYGLADRS
ncbi:phosphopyruvate hydratase [Nonomuraea basaltis]|uniref:phosphopyruvate hydratase n=1 Tax=Nonomuraea basaltis TaxID=2495887 RepID=UPI00110C553A|nr:phosphopyruvate hydratase [Nonomuraea basaltis]TMS00504.1 phosphopyruvate hydratase [Nonomuraea basaltis]